MNLGQCRHLSSGPEKKKDSFSPFNVGLGKEAAEADQRESSGTFSRLMGFFGKTKDSSGTDAQKGAAKDVKPKEKPETGEAYQEKLKKENEKLDQIAEPDTRKAILSMIEKNINQSHFNEKRLGVFFEKCWQLREPRKFKNESDRFYRFVYEDLKALVSRIDKPANVVELSKFVVFFGVDDDPEFFDLLADAVSKKMRYFKVDDILTILVNFAHSLSPNAQELFMAANQEFGQRLRSEFLAMDPDLYIKPEDMVKLLNVLLQHKQLRGDLKQQIIETLESDQRDYSYEILAELAIIYATKMDGKYQ